MLPLCDLESLCGVPDPLKASSLTRKLSFQLLRRLLRVRFTDPTLKHVVRKGDSCEVLFPIAFWSSKGLAFRICLIPNRLRMHGLATVFTLCLIKNLRVLFHTPTLLGFTL